MDPEAVFTQFLAERDLRMTSQRRAVFEKAMGTHQHFDADTLVREITKGMGDASQAGAASRASVFRTLNLLVDAGLLKKVLAGDRKHFYERVIGHHGHDHITCVKCDRIIEFKDPSVQERLGLILEKAGFEERDPRIQIMGTCKYCTKKASPGNG